jgi:hypothetical protein
MDQPLPPFDTVGGATVPVTGIVHNRPMIRRLEHYSHPTAL